MFTHVVGANCNSPILQFALVTNSPTLQIAHVFNCPHVEGLIAISPYTGVIRTFANIRVNTQKRHQGHGMRVFAYVVGANCNSPSLQFAHVTNRPCHKSPILQITHVTNHPHVEGLIAISPYTGVIRTFANIRVNTQKRHHGHGMGSFAHVVGAICKSPILQFALCCCMCFPSNRPHYKFTHVFNCPHSKSSMG